MSEEGAHRIDDIVMVVDDVEHLPFVEGGAGVGNAEGNEIAHGKRALRRTVQADMLIVECRGGIFAGDLDGRLM
jgi:hypothetical protein